MLHCPKIAIPLAVAMLAILSPPNVAGAAVLEVQPAGFGTSDPCPAPRDAFAYMDIQSAVDCAENGDEIALAPAIFRGARNRNIQVDKTLTIRGGGPTFTTLDAESLGRHFLSEANALTLAGMTLRRGLVEEPAGAFSAVGGSVLFGGRTLRVEHCRFEDNAVRFFDTGGWSAAGGAIAALRPSDDPGDTVWISDSVFVRNTVQNLDGQMNGAALEVGDYDGGDTQVGLRIERSSFVDNRSFPGLFLGGAVVRFGSGNPDAKAVLTNTLITSHLLSNFAFRASRAELEYSTLLGLGASALVVDAPVTAVGSMILSIAGGNACTAGAVISAGHNLDTDGTCALSHPTDRNAVSDPGVVFMGTDDASGQSYFGLRPDSQALDGGGEACAGLEGLPLVEDQRGQLRPQGTACDIGSIEVLGPDVFAHGFESEAPAAR